MSVCMQDLNREPGLTDIPTSSVDAVVCSNGLQYLTRPETVLREASGSGGHTHTHPHTQAHTHGRTYARAQILTA